MNHYAVIMAGGAGTRFWPLSRRRFPKQLLQLFSEKSMLEETIERIQPLFPPENILVICNRKYANLVKQALPQIPKSNIIGEPVGRNTAPCLALAAQIIYQRDPISVMCALPADHFIKDVDRFRILLDVAIRAAAVADTCVTFGVIPATPHTGYGYIQAIHLLTNIEGTAVLQAEKFVEKPNRHTAEEYLQEGHYYWNSGMFVWKTTQLMEEIARYQPEIHEPLATFFQKRNPLRDEAEFERVFSRLPAVSIDYGVMEKSRQVALVRCDCGWNDVGSWDAMDVLPHGPTGNVTIGGNTFLQDTKNCIVYGKESLVACLGVQDLVVVATADAVLVVRKDRAQEVKQITEQLAENKLDQYL